MKIKVLYTTKCWVCGLLCDWVLRDTNVNRMSNEDVLIVIQGKKEDGFKFDWCEKCKMETKQEIVAFKK